MDFVKQTEEQPQQLQEQARGDVMSDQITELQDRTQELRDQLSNYHAGARF